MKDLISREAAVAVCSAEYQECLRKSDWSGDTVAWNIGFRLKQLPAVDAVEVVHAVWDFVEENSTGKIFLCSACGFPHNPNKKDVGLGRVKEKPNYCPNCGARMDGE